MTVEERLARLEGSNRRLRAALVVVVAGFAAALLMAAKTATSKDLAEIRSSAFILVDDRGLARAKLWLTKYGTEFDMNGEDGTPRVSILADNERVSGGLTVSDSRGRTRAGIGVIDDAPSILIVGTDGVPRVTVGERSVIR